jgi:hypothetical protein
MKHRTARWMTTGGLGASSLSYLLNDSFTTARTAGTINGTVAEPGPGTRTVVDTNSKLSTTADALSIATGGFGSGDPGLYYGLQTRTAGRLLVAQAVSTTETFGIGFDPNQLSAINHAVRWAGSSRTWQIYVNGLGVSIGNWTIGATYNIAVVMRATGAYFFAKVSGNWQLLYPSAAGSQDCYPAIAVESSTGVLTVDYIRIPDTLWLPTPLVSDGFSGSTSDGLGHAETSGLGSGGSGVSWTGATWAVSGGVLKNTPTLGSELLVDGGMENWTTATNLTSWSETVVGTSTINQETSVINSGSNALRFDQDASNSQSFVSQAVSTIGRWHLASAYIKSNLTGKVATIGTTNNPWAVTLSTNISTTYTQYVVTGRATGTGFLLTRGAGSGSSSIYFDDVSFKQLTLSTLFRTANFATADVFVSVAVTLTAGTQAGLVLNLDSTSSPANFVSCYHNGSQVVLDKCVGGTYTNLFSSTVTYVAGARLELRKDGTAYRVYYNTVFVGTQQTVSDAGITSNTLHGTFSTYELNEFDNLVIYPTGNSGEYSVLDSY